MQCEYTDPSCFSSTFKHEINSEEDEDMTPFHRQLRVNYACKLIISRTRSTTDWWGLGMGREEAFLARLWLYRVGRGNFLFWNCNKKLYTLKNSEFFTQAGHTRWEILLYTVLTLSAWVFESYRTGGADSAPPYDSLNHCREISEKITINTAEHNLQLCKKSSFYLWLLM